MTKREVAQLMTILQANYPDSFRGQSDAVVAAKVTLWYEFFGNYPAEVVVAAAKAFMATDTKGFMPNVGQIAEQIQRLRERGGLMTPAEAWGHVAKAAGKAIWYANEAYEALPEECKRAVGSPDQLREWAMMDTHTLQSVVASNFQRSFQLRQTQSRDQEKLPEDIKAILGRISGPVERDDQERRMLLGADSAYDR